MTDMYASRFAIAFQEADLNADLCWSHYRALLTVENDALRRSLAERAHAEKLSKVQLPGLIAATASRTVFPFQPRSFQPGIYKVVIDADTVKMRVSLGFGENVISLSALLVFFLRFSIPVVALGNHPRPRLAGMLCPPTGNRHSPCHN